MSSVYAKFIAEAAYKHSVDKPNTGYNIAFYEESGRTSHRVDLDSIWVESKYIPIVAPEVEDDGIYYVTEGSSKLKVLQKLENIKLDKVDGTKATYYSVFLKDAIFPSYGTGYSIKLTDWNDEEIPFGLNQWVIDPDNGEITFLAGWPEGYQETPKISFYRYVGRKADDTFLRSDGTVSMIDTYTPSNDQDIATKKYVDDNVGDVSTILQKLIPTEPPTLEGADLSLDYDKDIYASPWNSTTKMPVVYYDDDYKIIVPQFYNPGKGKFHINVNSFDILDVDLSTVSGPEIFDYWTVTSVVDPYRTSKVANGFYKSINSYIVLPKDVISSLVSDSIPYITIYCYTENGLIKKVSNSLTIGFDENIKDTDAYIGSFQLNQLQNESNKPIRYISGVPSLSAGTTFMYNYSIKDIAFFKNDYIGKFEVENLNTDLLESNQIYDKYFPVHTVSEAIYIPENVYSENINVSVSANKVTLEDNALESKTYNIRIDTISDESARKVSPITLSEDFEAQDWTEDNAKEDLNNNLELQMLNGLYQWPSGDYSLNGNFDDVSSTDIVSLSEIIAGPDYSDIKTGTRFVTFSFDMPYCNGFWISFENGQNIMSDKDTKAFKLSSLRCIVEGTTGWLDMTKPYEGILPPRETNDGCLVVPSCEDDKKYMTFGNEPLAGKLDIVIGINKLSDIKFSGIKIVFNT